MSITRFISVSLVANALLVTVPAFAAPTEADFVNTKTVTEKRINTWKEDMAKLLTSKRPHADVVADMKKLNDAIVSDFARLPCRNQAQAQEIETLIHKKFHELYAIAPDIVHGVNMSCFHPPTLIPTLKITAFTLKAEQDAAAKAAGAQAARDPEGEVNKVAKEWRGKVSKIVPYTGPVAGSDAVRATVLKAIETAKQELGGIPCKDDKLAEFATKAFVEGLKIDPVPFSRTYLTITCSGGKLKGTPQLKDLKI